MFAAVNCPATTRRPTSSRACRIQVQPGSQLCSAPCSRPSATCALRCKALSVDCACSSHTSSCSSSTMLSASRLLRRSLDPRFAGFRMFARKKGAAAPAETAAADDDQSAKRAELVKMLNQKFGKGTVWSMNDAPAKVDTTPSGCLTLDIAMGGGYPRGRIIEIFGPESTGKSTLALHALAENKKLGREGYYVDVENAFDGEYAESIGVKDLLFSQPSCGEDALNIVDEVIRQGYVSMVVVDSVSALTPRSEIEGEIGMPMMGGQARLMSSALRRIVASAAKMKVTVIFINQLRNKVGVVYGSPEVTSGGQALKYYASVRVDLRRKEVIERGSSSSEGGKEAVGVRIKAKIVKNKCAPPARVAEFDLMFGHGINALSSLLDAAQALGVVTQKGAYYYLDNTRLAQGREKVLTALAADPALSAQIESLTKEALASKMAAPGESSEDGSELGDEDEEPLDFEPPEGIAERVAMK